MSLPRQSLYDPPLSTYIYVSLHETGLRILPLAHVNLGRRIYDLLVVSCCQGLA